MNPRIPFVTAVVAALLVGGATTGGTNASWTDQRQLAAHQVSSGQMSYAATVQGGVTVTRSAGSTDSTSLVLDDTSVGRNLGQRITVTVGAAPTGVTATVGTTCPGAASATVDTTPTSADQMLCVRVTSSPTAVSGSVTLTLSSAQRPAAGWTTAAITRTVAVTVDQPATPTTPALVCGTRSGNEILFDWEASTSETYTVERSTTSATSGYQVVTTSGSSPTTVSLGSNNTVEWWRVRAFVGTTPSSYSNVLQLRRANGASSITCGAPS